MKVQLWKILLDAKYTNVGEWLEEELIVVAPNALSAVRKARKHVRSYSFDNGAKGRARCVNSRLTGVELRYDIDVV